MENVDPERLERLAESFVNDMGAALTCALARVGDRLGLYGALHALGSGTSVELAKKTGLSERMLREWLVNQAAGGYIQYDPASGRYSLSPEQAALLVDERGRRYLGGGFQFATALVKAEERIAESFRHGKGVHWGEHHPDLSHGVGRFFRPAYTHDLATVWLAKVGPVREKLERGATVADIGCGYGYSTVALAEAFPQSRFHGFDSHPPSIDGCREFARERGVEERVTFEVASALDFTARPYDVVAYFNCLHDVGNPRRSLAHARSTMKADGLLLMSEPMAGHRVEENFNAVGRIMSGSSVLCCTPHGIADGGEGLGTLVTDEKLRAVALEAGFSQFERVHETRYSRVFLGRP
jgi:2-polyprenyl-3-methyl-5-hydroxy-6-metoxy-1,4-benzoquinol methylase